MAPAEATIVPRQIHPAAVLNERNNKQQACNAKQFTSACSCIGIRPSTITLPGRELTTTLTRVSTYYTTRTQISTSIITEIQTGPSSTSTATVTVTSNPDDAVPTSGGGCPRDGGVYRIENDGFQGGNEREFLVDETGLASLMRNGNPFFITRSGLLRRYFEPNLVVSAGEDGYLYGGEDVGSDAVLRCEVPTRTYTYLNCAQGGRTGFYKCPANANGTTVAIGNAGEGCQPLRFLLADPCQR